MACDLVVRNGLVIDGTGAPARRADVAVAGGRITAIGDIADAARRTIDAADLVVAPGFIDPHTHYDAQICWDGAVTPSSWHGVTSVVMGNCGVGIAPCKPETREIAMRDLVNVEAIPFDVLKAGITWDWETFPDYMAAAAKRNPSLNLAFLAPLTPFRHYVMGEASMERAANTEETQKIKALLGQAVDAGAFGFSTGLVYPPSSYAETSELITQRDSSLVTEYDKSLVGPAAPQAASLMTMFDQGSVPARGESVFVGPSLPPSPDTRLQVVYKGEAQAFPMPSSTITIGRGANNDIPLTDPKASQRHVQITWNGTEYHVTDLKSTNGTFLGNTKLLPGIPEVWRPHHNLRIGDTWLRLLRPTEGAPKFRR